MESKTALMLVLSLIGIMALLFLSQIIEPKASTIAQIKNQTQSFFQSNQEIKIIANITSIRQVENSTTFFVLKDSSSIITGVIFEASPEILTLNKSKTYEITGKISEYENKTEIIVSKIKPIIIAKAKTKT